MKNICFLQGTFSYTPCSRRGLTKNICFSANIYVPKNICFFEKVYMFFEKVCIFFKSIYFLRKAPSRTPYISEFRLGAKIGDARLWEQKYV